MKSVDTNTTHNAASPSAPRRGRWAVVVMASLLILLFALLTLLAFVSGVGAQGFMPPPMAAAYPTPKDVVGDLGGMPVRIARHIPHLVEYDGDPGWGAKRQGPPPERTHASPLKSFGVHVRYPDMATLSSPELWAEFEKKRLYNHPWLDFGIQSGSPEFDSKRRKLLIHIGQSSKLPLQEAQLGIGGGSFDAQCGQDFSLAGTVATGSPSAVFGWGWQCRRTTDLRCITNQ